MASMVNLLPNFAGVRLLCKLPRERPGRVPRTTEPLWRLLCAGLLALLGLLVACGGGEAESEQASTKSQGAASAPSAPPGVLFTALLAQPLVAFNGGKADPGLLMLLLPDQQLTSDDRVTSWLDAASEVGARMAPVSDAQFLAMGSQGALRYAGLVLPDQLHAVASDALLAAVRDYTTQGGKTLLSHDFGALTLNGAQQPVYPIPRSRLSDLAGVEYVLYDELRDRTAGLGPVTALRSTMRALLVPPGKSLPYPAAVPAPAASDLLTRSAGAQMVQVPATSVLAAASLEQGQALYLPVSPADPGGVSGFDPQQFQNLPLYAMSERRRGGDGGMSRRVPTIQFGRAFSAGKLRGVTPPAIFSVRAPDATSRGASTETIQANTLPSSSADPLEAYHGYLLGHLVYPSFVTRGSFAGTALAESPDFGLVAGVHTVGTGRVLFVNLPLGYLKGRTDALPMHGFLHYFLQQVVQGARLSSMPNAVAGLSFDWHLDSVAAQAPSLALEAAGVFNRGPFSMEMTAGPDAVVPGDGRGWDLPRNPVAQQLMLRLDGLGHAMGSHGGWVHDFYGDGATEDNAAEFLPLLLQNQAAVDGLLGRPARSYSAPQGNNPIWAMDWLAQQGVVGTYFGGHTGLGATRQYRDGMLRNPSVYVFPVTPQGLYATFEEFQDYAVPKQQVIDWYRGLVDFSLAQNTSRLVYAHPPGANQWRDVLNNLLNYAQGKGAKFQWYTMPRLADFMTARQQVVWTQTPLSTGATRFDARHPQSLGEMVWMLPKNRYLKPVIVTAGGAVVVNGGAVWLVKAAAVTQLRFRAAPNPAFLPG